MVDKRGKGFSRAKDHVLCFYFESWKVQRGKNFDPFTDSEASFLKTSVSDQDSRTPDRIRIQAFCWIRILIQELCFIRIRIPTKSFMTNVKKFKMKQKQQYTIFLFVSFWPFLPAKNKFFIIKGQSYTWILIRDSRLRISSRVQEYIRNVENAVARLWEVEN